MLMTIDDLSAHLKISKETLYKLVQKDEVPGIKIGNQWRFKKSALDEWIDDSFTSKSSVEVNELVQIGMDTEKLNEIKDDASIPPRKEGRVTRGFR